MMKVSTNESIEFGKPNLKRLIRCAKYIKKKFREYEETTDRLLKRKRNL
jgi:hypothetical protein